MLKSILIKIWRKFDDSQRNRSSFFANSISAHGGGKVEIDGSVASISGIAMHPGSENVLKDLLRYRKVYVTVIVTDSEHGHSVRLFCGRGDIAAHLVWRGAARPTARKYSIIHLVAKLRNSGSKVTDQIQKVLT